MRERNEKEKIMEGKKERGRKEEKAKRRKVEHTKENWEKKIIQQLE